MNEFLDLVGRDLDADDPGSRDPEFIRRYVAPRLDALRRSYFRSEFEGVELMPPEGPVVAVANHNGGPVLADCWVLLSYFWERFGFERPAYALVHDAALRIPYLKNFIIRIGALRASTANAEKVLERGGVVLVFPGGDLDCFRSFRQRHRVDLQGRTGFIRVALRHRAPILPVVNVGGHETSIVLHSSRALARWSGAERFLRIKTVPISLALPWGLHVGHLPFLPLPAKISFKLGKPIRLLEGGSPDDEPLVHRAYLAIENTMQDMVDELASRRRFPVVG